MSWSKYATHQDYEWWYGNFVKSPEWWIDVLERKTTLDADTGCLLWTGATQQGYAKRCVSDGRDHIRQVSVHRVSFELGKGGLVIAFTSTIDHLCSVRHCVAPTHLQQISRAENGQLGMYSRHYPSIYADLRADQLKRV